MAAGALALAVVAGGCAGPASTLLVAPEAGLRQRGVGAPDDVMVRGARILPETLEDGRGWGAAPGGGERAIVGGERVVSWPDGTLAATVDRLPALPSVGVEVPARMGGGFLFALGSRLWHADTWLGRAEPLVTLSRAITELQVGLDRMYLRTLGGGLVAVDPRQGALVGLGPLPATPALGRMAALDAWRAVAIADLRGALLTLDAGATWRPLPLPIDPADVVLTGDAIAVGGTDEGHQAAWWEVRPDGHIGRLGGPPTAPVGAEAATSPDPSALAAANAVRVLDRHDGVRGALPDGLRAFGPRPLATAIADGWPLVDGTALVARDGSLARIRLSDGALVETVTDAFPVKPARCHPVSLARPRDKGAFGFVCGAPHGPTVVYRYSPADGRLAEARRFDGPREVLAFGNGALAVRGVCAPGAAEDAIAGDRAFCIMPPGGAWSELHVRGDDVDRATPVVLHDGRVALVRPPRGDDLSTMRLTLTEGLPGGAPSTHLPVRMPPMRADVARALRTGVWMDGFEERRDGVLGGWVDAGGSVVGVEIALDGQATVGSYIRAASDVFVSGRWGLGWTASRRGTETVDGGMTWKDFDVPDPIGLPRTHRQRACGPIGCLAAGWMRVGWGEPERAPVQEPPLDRAPPPHAPPRLELECTPRSGKAPEPRAATPRRGLTDATSQIAPFGGRWTAFGLAGGAEAGSADLPPLLARAAPILGSDDLGLSLEVTSTLDRTLRSAPFGRIYAWGPKSGDWDPLGRWSVAWLWPFGGWPDVRASAATAAPWTSIESARRGLQLNTGAANGWMLAPGDDADHALLVGRRLTSVATADVVVLEMDRAPSEVRRPGGEPFAEVEAAERLGGSWYLATAQSPGELAATVLWLVDGDRAHEITRIPRAATDGHPTVRLARRADGRALGLLVDGLPDAERGMTMRWIMPIDLESAGVGDPEALAPADLSDRAVTSCTGDDAGWVVDLPYPGSVVLNASPAWRVALQSPLARMRVSRDGACVERMGGMVEGYAGAVPEIPRGPMAGEPPPSREARAIDVAVFSARTRYSLRCSIR
jgi:hypothetical protein